MTICLAVSMQYIRVWDGQNYYSIYRALLYTVYVALPIANPAIFIFVNFVVFVLTMSPKVNTACSMSLPLSFTPNLLKTSATVGQGFVQILYDCADYKKNCGTNGCKCFKNKRMCNSRCHHSTTCRNK